jgi:hypothetical protein
MIDVENVPSGLYQVNLGFPDGRLLQITDNSDKTNGYVVTLETANAASYFADNDLGTGNTTITPSGQIVLKK